MSEGGRGPYVGPEAQARVDIDRMLAASGWVVQDYSRIARGKGLPLAWVHAGNRRPGTREPTSVGAEQGRVSYERVPTVQGGAER